MCPHTPRNRQYRCRCSPPRPTGSRPPWPEIEWLFFINSFEIVLLDPGSEIRYAKKSEMGTNPDPG